MFVFRSLLPTNDFDSAFVPVEIKALEFEKAI